MDTPFPGRPSPPPGAALVLAFLLAGMGTAGVGTVPGVRAQETTGRSLSPLPGPIQLAVDPAHAAEGATPVLWLGYRTVHEYSCYGYRIAAELARSADSLHLEIHGVGRGGLLCSPAFGPATGGVAFDVPRGDYALTVRHRNSADRHRLEVREAWVRLVPRRAELTIPDTRRKWLYPERSFALYCGATEGRELLCARLAAWLGRVPGLEPFSFGPDGVVPYRRGIGARHRERHYFRYAKKGHLAPAWACLESLSRRTGPL